MILPALCLCVSVANPVIVTGTLPPGAQLEFVAQGAEERLTATAGADGAYRLELPAARYDITLNDPTAKATKRRLRGTAWLVEPEIRLNADPESPLGGRPPDYDLIAEWQVQDAGGKPAGPAQVSIEVELPSSAGVRTEKLNIWVHKDITGEEEIESAGLVTSTPDGRVTFRAKEARLSPDRVTAILVTAEMPGHSAGKLRLTPVLKFSAFGHFYAVYPDEGVAVKLGRK